MVKVYLDKNVYEATQERLEFIFNNFDNILIAFSGGKDSGVLFNLAYDYAKQNNMLAKVAMYHLDYEAQYTATTEYVTKCFEGYPGIKKYWLCLPIAAQCAVSMTSSYWVPWEKSKQDIWARPMPNNQYVINEDNVPFDFKPGTADYTVQDGFSKWYANHNGKTAILIGIRTDESMNRYRAIAGNHKVNTCYGKNYLVGNENICRAYPIYDWTAEDIWIANARFGYSYNKLYDLFYQAGLSIHEMRVASPFNDCAINALKIYKVVEPSMWAKLVGRVNGVNFAGIYGGTTAMGWKSIQLPAGHTWKSYLEFLLSTLPEDVRNNYVEKFKTSIEFWRDKGGVLDDKTIQELKDCGIKIEVGNKTNYKTSKKPVRFAEYPDDADVTEFQVVPSYKRMCVCIMKNDHLCKYMGFTLTKKEQEKRRRVIAKYKDIIHGGDGDV